MTEEALNTGTQPATNAGTQPATDPAGQPATQPEGNVFSLDKWRDAFKDEAVKKEAERSNSLEDFGKRIVGLNKTLSRAIVKPGKDAKPDEILAYKKALGVPEKVDGYVFEAPAGYEFTDSDKEFQSAMAKAFHDNNVPLDAAKGLVGVYNEFVKTVQEAQIAADKKYADESLAALKKEYGPEFDRNIELSKRGARYIWGDSLGEVAKIEGKDGKFVLDNPLLIRGLAKLGREVNEDGVGPRPMSDDERGNLRVEAQKIVEQKMNALAAGKFEEAKALDAKARQLYDKLHPEDGRQPQ